MKATFTPPPRAEGTVTITMTEAQARKYVASYSPDGCYTTGTANRVLDGGFANGEYEAFRRDLRHALAAVLP